MSRILKTFLSVFVLALFAVAGQAAHAASVSGSNSTTGASSDNSNNTTVNSTSSVTVNNDSSTTNSVTVHANTGGNNSNGNTVGGAITTGNISGTITINSASNNGNSSFVGTIDPGSGSFSVSNSNSWTGANSNNRNNTDLSGQNSFSELNNAQTSNDISLNANTGQNNANRNTVGGQITTGSISTLVDIGNTSNSPGKGGASNPGTPTGPQGNVLALASGGALSPGKGGGQVLATAGSNSLVLSLLLALIITIGITQAQRSRKHVVRLE